MGELEQRARHEIIIGRPVIGDELLARVAPEMQAAPAELVLRGRRLRAGPAEAEKGGLVLALRAPAERGEIADRHVRCGAIDIAQADLRREALCKRLSRARIQLLI